MASGLSEQPIGVCQLVERKITLTGDLLCEMPKTRRQIDHLPEFESRRSLGLKRQKRSVGSGPHLGGDSSSSSVGGNPKRGRTSLSRKAVTALIRDPRSVRTSMTSNLYTPSASSHM